jgi:predicted nucleic acid-binding protein
LTLVDTSVWIDFFRRGSAASRLARALGDGEVRTHPFVIGELALGSLGRARRTILADLRMLPILPIVAEAEVHQLVEARDLAASGIGWVDAHLIASAVTGGCPLWTLDRRLARVASALGAA